MNYHQNRMHTENMVLYGLWLKEAIPFIRGFTKPLVKALRDQETNDEEFLMINNTITAAEDAVILEKPFLTTKEGSVSI